MDGYLSSNSKGKNDLQILNYLLNFGAKSRVDIARDLKLTKAAITIVTNDMLKLKMITEKGEQNPDMQRLSRGRRKIFIDINENYKLVFGVAVKKSEVLIGLSNLKGQILDKSKFSLKDKNYREMLSEIVKSVSLLMKNNCIAGDDVLALGICFGMDCSELLEGNSLSEKLSRIKKDLRHGISMKISTAKTMHGAIVAQKLFSPLSHCQNTVILRCGDGVAESGLLLNSRPYDGNNSKAGGFYELMNSPLFYPCEPDYQRVAHAISLINTMIDPQSLLVFGSFFEQGDSLALINEIIKSIDKKLLGVSAAFVTEDTLFLSACANAIDVYFYGNT